MSTRISMVVCTRNRPDGLQTLLTSIASLVPQPHEVLIVDQSTNDSSARVVEQTTGVTALRCLRDRATGLSLARNYGVGQSHGDIVAFTDDDCRLDKDFVGAVASVFARITDAGLVFGRVAPGPHDASSGMVPHCGREDEMVVRAPSDLRLIGGMGACMAVRRSTLLRLGGFDVCLGAGARFPAAEETDLAFRILVDGAAVIETPTVAVTHDGFRTWAELARLSDAYLLGSGAMHAKHLRLWPAPTARLLLAVARRWAWDRPRINYLREPCRGSRLWAFAQGAALGMLAPLDRKRGLFQTNAL